MATKATFTQIKLPQLSMANLDRWKQSKPSIRSLNLKQDRSYSPPKNRTDMVSRGSMSMTPHHISKPTHYNFRNIMKFDQSFSDQDLFSANQNIDKLNQRLKSISRGRNSPKKTAQGGRRILQQPYLEDDRNGQLKQPNLSPKNRVDSVKKRKIKERILEIYDQVKMLLQNHKGYVRQSEKKQTQVKLIELKKEFKLLNQDYNDFYLVPTTTTKLYDYQLMSSYAVLQRLFNQNKEVRLKNQAPNIFEDEELSFNIPTETDEVRTQQIFTEEIKELDAEHSLIKEEEYSQANLSQQSIATGNNSPTAKSNPRTSKLINRQSRLNIMPIQAITNQEPQTPLGPIRRRSSIRLPGDSGHSRDNRFTQNPALPALQKPPTPPQTPKSQYSNKSLHQQANEVVQQIIGQRQAGKRESKILTRQATKFGAGQKDNDTQSELSRQNSRRIDEQSEQELISDQMRQTEETKSRPDYTQDMIGNHAQIEEALERADLQSERWKALLREEGKAVEFIERVDQSGSRRNKNFDSTNVFNQIEIRREKASDKNLNLIIALSECKMIYAHEVVDEYRLDPAKTSWEWDIECILDLKDQFR